MRCAYLLAILLSVLSQAVSATRFSPKDVLEFADLRGDRAALAEFFSCDGPGDNAYSYVSSGDIQWLSVAARLLPSADACYSESLRDAVARALVRAPARVLAYVGSGPAFAADRICVPFLSAEEPAGRHLAYLRKAERAIRSVHAPALEIAGDACLIEIVRIRKMLGRDR